jgi:putative membrane protein
MEGLNMDGWAVFWSILFFVLITIAIIYAAYQWAKFFHDRFHKQESERPLNIARERYARGEITREELNEIKKNLS